MPLRMDPEVAAAMAPIAEAAAQATPRPARRGLEDPICRRYTAESGVPLLSVDSAVARRAMADRVRVLRSL